MPLTSSGQISLNDLHVEAGGTTGTQASMNDTDIRGLLGADANSQMTFSSFYGASAGIGILSTTMTVGNYNNNDPYVSSISNGYHSNTATGVHGRAGTIVFGAMGSNSVGSIQSGATISQLLNNNLVNTRLQIDDNTAVSNSGWTSVQVGSTTYLRTAASFTAGVNNNSNSQGFVGTWSWAGSTNPFGTSGTVNITIA
jgi:hypothetical protein